MSAGITASINRSLLVSNKQRFVAHLISYAILKHSFLKSAKDIEQTRRILGMILLDVSSGYPEEGYETLYFEHEKSELSVTEEVIQSIDRKDPEIFFRLFEWLHSYSPCYKTLLCEFESKIEQFQTLHRQKGKECKVYEQDFFIHELLKVSPYPKGRWFMVSINERNHQEEISTRELTRYTGKSEIPVTKLLPIKQYVTLPALPIPKIGEELHLVSGEGGRILYSSACK